MMKRWYFAPYLAAFSLALCMASPVHAREMRLITYDELFAKSDFIAIARPATKSKDTKESTYFLDIFQTDANAKQHQVPAIGVETAFDVIKVLKGDARVKQFVLHHYRDTSQGVMLDGPSTVSFDPSDLNRRRDILLFLIREKDGRYAPYGGQTDPGSQSIFALDGPP